MLRDLLAIAPEYRGDFMRHLDDAGMQELLATADRELGTPYGLWADDPVGFVRYVLRETTWSKQREVLTALTVHEKVAVPSAHGVGKTHIAARAALWRALVFPVGTSVTVTTATRFRQVQRQLWPHIRTSVDKASLPLQSDLTQLRAPLPSGKMFDVAYGFSAPPNDEAAVQGIHAPRLFIVVDEAGGIGRIIGEAMRGLLTGSDTRMLAIGNPATDDENSWFERLCGQDDTHVVRITAYDAPNQTGENVVCRTCPPSMGRHTLGSHLVDIKWINDSIRDHGEDAPYVIARVHAQFPKGGPSRAIPSQWIEAAYDAPEPEGGPEDGWYVLAELGMEGETSPYKVHEGSWIRLGVDVAADGGDEFVIARSVGDLFEVRHSSAGAANANPTDVAGKVLEEIKRAELLRARLGTQAKVRVKLDAIGVGWGVAGILEAWKTEGLHDADIVRVVVSEGTGREEAATFRPYRKRDEMWLAARSVLQPQPGEGFPVIRLRLDDKTRAQLSSPTYGTNASGKTVIESKKSLKDRGMRSPDRGEAVLLSLYEPLVPPKRRARLIVG
jgi:hypothetical protein